MAVPKPKVTRWSRKYPGRGDTVITNIWQVGELRGDVGGFRVELRLRLWLSPSECESSVPTRRLPPPSLTVPELVLGPDYR